MPLIRSVFPPSVTTSRVWPDEMQRRSAVSAFSDVSTVTTAGIGVMTWRASCSCRWKTPESIPASPGSSAPPCALCAISSFSSSAFWASSNSARGSVRSRRRIQFDSAVQEPDRTGCITTKKNWRPPAVRRAIGSACTIA